MNIDTINSKVSKYIINNLSNFDFNSPAVVGESKKIFKDKESNLILIQPIPSLYSFTENRYGEAPGTDIIRMKIWEVLDRNVSNLINYYLKGGLIKNKDILNELILAEQVGLIDSREYWHSGYYGNVIVNNTLYAIATWMDDATPLEFVYKKKLNGTMKHNLDCVDHFKTLQGNIIEYENYLPNGIVRFDWRNPLWKTLPDGEKVRRKDEAIPDDFAEFYTNTKKAKVLVRLYSKIVNEVYQQKGYELVDVCYFINGAGDKVYSEVSLDNMRVTKKENSFDKDLWRQGKDNETILKIWNKVLEDIIDVNLVNPETDNKPIILIPDGKMKETALDLLSSALNIELDNTEKTKLREQKRKAVFKFKNCEIHIIKPKYMKKYLEEVFVDVVMVTNAMLPDFENDFKKIHSHRFNGIKYSLISKNGNNIKNIKTIYTNSSKYAKLRFPDKNIKQFDGSLEAFPYMSNEIAIIDFIETGRSLKENNLMEIKYFEDLSLNILVK